MGQFEGLPNLDALEQLRAGLDVTPDNRHIISFTRNGLENKTIIAQLFIAISQQQVVALEYHKFGEAEAQRRTVVCPYLLKEYNRSWFLVAADYESGKVLLFALDRMDTVTPLPSYTYSPAKEDLQARFHNIIGVTLYDDQPVERIVFWASDTEQLYLKSKPIHHSQQPLSEEETQRLREQCPSCEGGVFFAIECVRNYELIRELCSYGSDLVVLSPTTIRNEIAQRLTQMQQRYNTIA